MVHDDAVKSPDIDLLQKKFKILKYIYFFANTIIAI